MRAAGLRASGTTSREGGHENHRIDAHPRHRARPPGGRGAGYPRHLVRRHLGPGRWLGDRPRRAQHRPAPARPRRPHQRPARLRRAGLPAGQARRGVLPRDHGRLHRRARRALPRPAAAGAVRLRHLPRELGHAPPSAAGDARAGPVRQGRGPGAARGPRRAAARDHRPHRHRHAGRRHGRHLPDRRQLGRADHRRAEERRARVRPVRGPAGRGVRAAAGPPLRAGRFGGPGSGADRGVRLAAHRRRGQPTPAFVRAAGRYQDRQRLRARRRPHRGRGRGGRPGPAEIHRLGVPRVPGRPVHDTGAHRRPDPRDGGCRALAYLSGRGRLGGVLPRRADGTGGGVRRHPQPVAAADPVRDGRGRARGLPGGGRGPPLAAEQAPLPGGPRPVRPGQPRGGVLRGGPALRADRGNGVPGRRARRGPGAPVVTPEPAADLLVTGAKLVATCDAEHRELAGGWVAVTGGLVSAVGAAGDPPPAARETLDAAGCLVTPGLVNTHHHMYQNLTRSYAPTVNGTLFEWLSGLYPLWAGVDEEAAYLSAWVALAELALGGCTTSTDHLYVAPRGGGDLWSAEIAAVREVGLRFHPTRGSMTVGATGGGLPPDSVVQDDDEVLADSERLVAAHHDPGWGAMVRVGLAPCSPFSVSPGLMRRTAELAEKLDVRLHTHLAEDPDEDAYCLERFGRRPVDQFDEVGWLGPRSWVAHCIYPNPAEVIRLGAAGVGVAHCPSSNMLIGGGGFAPVRELRAAGAAVGLGCDGSASVDSASLWIESRAALLLGRQRHGSTGMTAREVLDIATRGGAACLGRAGEIGELAVGAAGDLVCWPQQGLAFAGALTDPVEAWLRCGPTAARHTVVAGRVIVRDGALTVPGAEEVLPRHTPEAAGQERMGTLPPHHSD